MYGWRLSLLAACFGGAWGWVFIGGFMGKDTSGSAFPTPGFEEGMALRDYFAAKAMQGWLASYGPDMPHPSQNGYENDVARNAYKLADAMIKARGE